MYLKSVEAIFWCNWLVKFINIHLFMGKKELIEKVLYFSLFLIKKRLGSCPLFVFFEVLEKVKPIVGLKLYKLKTRKLYKVKVIPVILKFSLQYKKAIIWVLNSIVKNDKKKLIIKLFQEFYNINYNKGNLAIKKKKQLYDNVLVYKITKRFVW